jgi:hypothetical protein
MGIIRGGLLVIVSVLLFVSLFAGLILLTMSWSLNYSNVKVELGGVLKDNLKDKIGVVELVGDDYVKMQEYCKLYSDYAITYENMTITIPCSVILEGQDAIVNKGIDEFVEKIYFEQYDCSFWKCFETQKVPFFLVSSKAQAYWYSKFNYVLMLIALLSICGFLLAEKKSNFFLITSILVVIAVIPFAKMDWLISLTGKTAEGLLSVFFSKSYSVFIRGLFIGIILLLIGILLKFFNIGFKIQSIFSKFGKSKDEKEEKKPEVKEKKEEVKPQKIDSKKVIKKVIRTDKKK